MSIITLILYVLTNTIPRWITGINGDLFCKWQAVSYMLLCIAAMTKKQGKSNVWIWAALLTFNNAYDEVFGDPKNVGWVELSFAATVTIWLIYTLIKCRPKPTQYKNY